jgi:hypothetical protein
MNKQFEQWTRSRVPVGRRWAARAAALAAAGTATVAIGLSVVLMAGLNLPAGEARVEARAPVAVPTQAAASSAQPSLRYATALPTVTIVGRRVRLAEASPAAVEFGDLPAGQARVEATVGISVAGDNLPQ